jgi:DNA-binding transcriptional LysR family regulator
VRLRECNEYPVVLPTNDYGVRQLIETSLQVSSLEMKPVIQSDSFEFLRSYVTAESAISFQIPIGLPPSSYDSGLRYVPIAEKDVPPGILYMGQLHKRTLPVAVAKFADQVSIALAESFETC